MFFVWVTSDFRLSKSGLTASVVSVNILQVELNWKMQETVITTVLVPVCE